MNDHIEWLGHADIETYQATRKGLSQINLDGMSDNEAAHIRAMINDCDYIIRWLKCGHRPDGYYGIETNRKVAGERLSMDQRYVWVDPLKMQSYARRGCGSPTTVSDSEMDMLDEALSELSPMQRECFVLHKGRNMTHDEIAYLLKIDRRNVNTHIQRAELKIAKRLYNTTIVRAM